jgi:hypothetical protein
VFHPVQLLATTSIRTTKLSGRSLDLIHLDQQEYTALQLNAPKIGA